jgi:hypothetical protein
MSFVSLLDINDHAKPINISMNLLLIYIINKMADKNQRMTYVN